MSDDTAGSAAPQPTRLTFDEWQTMADALRAPGQPVTVHLRSRFWIGLLIGLLLGVAACVGVAIYALGQIT